MNMSFISIAFILIISNQLIFSQIDSSSEKNFAFGEISLMITGYEETTYFVSSSLLFGEKNSKWQNSIHVDIEVLDLVKTWGGGKNFYSLQFGKNYLFQKKWFVAKSCSGVGLYYYQFALPELESRTYGIVVSQSLEIGFSMKKINISTGFYLAVGYGYFKRYYEVPDYLNDSFKFTPIGNPFVKVTFKK